MMLFDAALQTDPLRQPSTFRGVGVDGLRGWSQTLTVVPCPE